MSRALEIELEYRIAKRVIMDALAAGYSLSVNDGEEYPVKRSTDAQAVFQALFSTDEDYLFLHKEGGKWCLPDDSEDDETHDVVGWVRLIWGNVQDLISDYSSNAPTDALIDPIYEVLNSLDSVDAARKAGLFTFDKIQAI